MALTTEQFQDGCSYLTQVGALAPANAGGALFIDASAQVVYDESDSNADVTPSEATILQALTDLATAQATQAVQNTAQNSIKELRDLATTHAPFIASLMSWALNADVNGDDADTRFSDLVSVMGTQGTGIQNLFKAAIEAETGIDVDTIGVGNLLTPQKQIINGFARGFANSWAIVLIS